MDVWVFILVKAQFKFDDFTNWGYASQFVRKTI